MPCGAVSDIALASLCFPANLDRGIVTPMARTLPPLPTFVAQIATALGGEPHLLDAGEYASAAVSFGGRHLLLVRDHKWTLTLSLPLDRSWPMSTPLEWLAVEPEIRAALASETTAVTLSDAIAAIVPPLAERSGNAWTVSFPGTPVPSEAWVKFGAQSIGLFQEENAVRVVVWVGAKMRSQHARARDALVSMTPWLDTRLREQSDAEAAAEREAQRLAALPLADLEAVVAHLQAGGRIAIGGGRWCETWFWRGGLRVEEFDEGYVAVEDGSEEKLRARIASHPTAFREALIGCPKRRT